MLSVRITPHTLLLSALFTDEFDDIHGSAPVRVEMGSDLRGLHQKMSTTRAESNSVQIPRRPECH